MITENDIEQCLHAAATRYFAECRQRIPFFCKRYFAYPGCWRLNRAAFGWDLIRAPLNLFWAPIYLICRLALLAARKFNWHKPQAYLTNLPAGFTTRVQKSLSEHIYRELMQRDSEDSQADRFINVIIEELEKRFEQETPKNIDHREINRRFAPLVKETLEQYNVTRTASADITNVAASTALGAFAFKKFTPGGIGLGFLFAGYAVKEAAIDSFIFGQTLGSAYYKLFPPQPELSTLIISTLVSLTLLAFFSAISGVISDPLQYSTGLHAKRLQKMINQLERDFLLKTNSTYHPKDQYLARALDIFDGLKSHLL